MRKAFLYVSIFFFLIGVIIAVENIGGSGSGYILLKSFSGDLMGPFFIMLVIGMISGFFLGMALASKPEKKFDDDF